MNKKLARALTSILLILTLSLSALALTPSAPNSLTVHSNSTFTPQVGSVINTSGGYISTVTLNTTTVNYRWKGFVGNVSGKLALVDSSDSSLFDWDIATVTGEIYATRNESIPSWDDVTCVTDDVIRYEQEWLNITESNADSINNTFQTTVHDEFYVGFVKIDENSCRSIALNVNNTAQSTNFQEILLTDGYSLIYSSLLENSTYGFNNQSYDFQMIVAESGLPGIQSNTAYYLYVELI